MIKIAPNKTTWPKSFCKIATKYTTIIKIIAYGISSFNSFKNGIFSCCIRTLLNDQLKKYINPTLKNSTGANENPNSLIQRFAPPTSVTNASGKKVLKTNGGPVEFFETPFLNPGLFMSTKVLYDHLIVADEDHSKFGYSEVKIGFVPAIVSIFVLQFPLQSF